MAREIQLGFSSVGEQFSQTRMGEWFSRTSGEVISRIDKDLTYARQLREQHGSARVALGLAVGIGLPIALTLAGVAKIHDGVFITGGEYLIYQGVVDGQRYLNV